MKRWDIYWAEVPFEDDPTQTKLRPAIIARDKIETALVIRVTSRGARDCDPYDYEIQDWKAAGLKEPSTVRISKITQILPDKIYDFIGRLSIGDIFEIQRLMDEYKESRYHCENN